MLRHNLYTTDMDKRRNCYNCRGFGYIMRNCRNQRIVEQERMINYQRNYDNLKENKNLIVLN